METVISYLLGQQQQSQWLKETEQIDKEGWLCAVDLSEADDERKSSA